MRDFGLPSRRLSHNGMPGSRRRRAPGTCTPIGIDPLGAASSSPAGWICDTRSA